MNDERIWSLAKEQQAWVSSVRRALHRVPEPGFREEKTKKLICEKLNEIGVAPVCERGWITAVVDSGEDGPVTGFRADFDALPVTEPRGCRSAPSTRATCMPAGTTCTRPSCWARRGF